MKTSSKSIWALAGMLILAAAPAQAADNTPAPSGASTDPAPATTTIIERDRAEPRAVSRSEEVTVRGRVVDLVSYLTDGSTTAYDPAKLRAGEAPLVGLLTEDNKVHLILNVEQNSEVMRSLRTQSGERYSVTGEVKQRGGLSAIKIKSLAVATGNGAASSVDRGGETPDPNDTSEPSVDGQLNPSDIYDKSDPNANHDGKVRDTNIKDRGPASTNVPNVDKVRD